MLVFETRGMLASSSCKESDLLLGQGRTILSFVWNDFKVLRKIDPIHLKGRIHEFFARFKFIRYTTLNLWCFLSQLMDPQLFFLVSLIIVGKSSRKLKSPARGTLSLFIKLRFIYSSTVVNNKDNVIQFVKFWTNELDTVKSDQEAVTLLRGKCQCVKTSHRERQLVSQNILL